MNTIKKYDAYLTFEALTADQSQKVQSLFDTQDLLVTLDPDALEFEFNGRDLSDYVVHVFQEVAKVIKAADGEIRCEMDDDDWRDPKYKFFTIRDGVLWEQAGELVRCEQVQPSEWAPPTDDVV